jgi:hypothetical protein
MCNSIIESRAGYTYMGFCGLMGLQYSLEMYE